MQVKDNSDHAPLMLKMKHIPAKILHIGGLFKPINCSTLQLLQVVFDLQPQLGLRLPL